MNRLRTLRLLLITFTILTVASVLGIYYSHQKPASEKQTIIVGVYWHKAAYNYAAELKPNIIYNKTILRPGEGTLYTAITNRINITFTYTFASNPNPEAANITLKAISAEIESPGKWIKTLSENEIKEILKLTGSVNFTFEVDCASIRQIVDRIDKEVGVYSTSYNIYVAPTIHVKANINSKIIDEIFTPKLTIMFKTGADKGNYISMEGLNQTRSGEIRETKEIPHPEVEAQRNISYAATTVTAIGLAASAITYLRSAQRYKPGEEQAEKIKKTIEEYKDIIVEAAKPPETQITIDIKSLEDLAKIAEILAKPILKTADGETFYIIDNGTKYQYKAKNN